MPGILGPGQDRRGPEGLPQCADSRSDPGFRNPDDATVRGLLERVRRIAVVGLTPKAYRDSHRVARYLLEHGYEDVPGPVDLVDVFRRSESLPEVIDDVAAARAGGLWLQVGCIDVAGARRARDAGLTVVMDRCLMVEHGRLIGRH